MDDLVAEAEANLSEMTMAIGIAVQALKSQEPMLRRYLDEAESMDSFGPIFDPTLFNSSERRATDAIMRPIVKASLDYLRAHEMATAAAKAALEKLR